MRISLTITNFSWPGGSAGLADRLGRIARQADEGGVDTVWVSDHLLQGEPGTDPTQEMLEAYTTLGHLSSLTRRIRLGAMVSPVTLNRPGFGGDSSVESQATRLVRSPSSYRASNSAGGLPPQAP